MIKYTPFKKLVLALKGLNLLKKRRLSEHTRKRLAKKEAGLKYHLKCLYRHRKKGKDRRRKAAKQASRSRRINRKRSK